MPLIQRDMIETRETPPTIYAPKETTPLTIIDVTPYVIR